MSQDQCGRLLRYYSRVKVFQSRELAPLPLMSMYCILREPDIEPNRLFFLSYICVRRHGIGDCFFRSLLARGTCLATVTGFELVETLTIGDHALTAFGESRRIKWIGHRSYAGRFLAANPNVQPIRFCVGSLGTGLPHRDLLVSPEHAMFLDGLLVPARCLVNGSTITQERGLSRIEYFHIELDAHDIILAESAASETFLDDDSRSMFHNASEYAALYPDTSQPSRFCAPRVTDGYQLEAIRQRLAEVSGQMVRAAQAG